MFLFYVFWEVMLLPMYFLIGIWGGPRKEYAAIKFFLYTLAGSVLIALNPTGQLVFFEPNDKEFKQLASYKVAEEGTYAYPVVAGNRVYIKDRDSLTLWTIE
jgi:NADH:ubiquinone oxidoreductase subunit 4 (subunit M)